MMDRIIAVNSNCYHGYSIEEAIAGIKAAGFKYIELTATKGWTEHVFPDQSFERLLEVKDLLEEAGLIPFAMSGHTNLMDTERIPDFVKNIRLAHFFGAKYIVSSIGEAHLKDNAVASNEVVAEHIKGFLPYLEKYDMILSPVSPTTAYEIGGQISDPIAMYMADIYTVSVNLSGIPAVALPCGKDSQGLPVGMQLIGKAFSEETLVAAAAEYQRATDFHKAVAPFAAKGGRR